MTHSICGIAAALLAAAARSADAEPRCRWHADAELRPSIDIHPVRVGGGVCRGRLDVSVLVDPLVAIDHQHDLDVMAGLAVGTHGWRVTGGWRETTIALADGLSWQDKAVGGATAALPSLSPHLHASVGLEASVLVVKHGGGIETEWLSVAAGRRFWESYELGMFVRVAYGR